MFWRKSEPTLTIFFTTDLHGSERCFRKFLNAAKFYKADVIILGGDVTGKMIVPIARHPQGYWTADYMGRRERFDSEEATADFERIVRDNGHYPFRADEDEVAYYESNPERQHELFVRVLCDSVRAWMALADERLAGTGVRCFMAPGNDDPDEIGPILDASECVQNIDERIVDLDETHRLVGIGYSNPTPWHTNRELPEEELGRRMERLFAAAGPADRLVASLHVPPYDSSLDTAPVLSVDLQVQTAGGQAKLAPVGSTAVRAVIEKYQPLLSLHGHIHESQGHTKIGRTLCLNPGSEYHEAVLKGALITLSDDKVKHYQFVTG